MTTISAATRARIRLTRSGSHWMLLGAWGVMQGLSYPWPNLWPLAYVALVPLIVLALRGAPTRRVAVNTFFAAWLWHVVMVRWMFPVTWPGTIGVAVYMGLYVVAFVLLLRMIQRRAGGPLVLVVPVVWVALEWFRGWWWTGFGWFYLGHSQPAVMIQIADVVGAHGVSFMVAMVSGAIGDVLARPLVRLDEGGRPRAAMALRMSMPVAIGAVVVSLIYGVWRLDQTDEIMADSLPAPRVAVVQTNVPQSNKNDPAPGQEQQFFQVMIDLSKQALAQDPQLDLIVWPETMIPRPLNDESIALFSKLNPALARYRSEVEALAAESGVSLIVGAHGMTGWQPTGDYFRPAQRYNSAYLVTPTGVTSRYDKIHRVPFGEYIPWVETIPWAKRWLLKLTPYDWDYTLTAGAEIVRMEVPIRVRPLGGAMDGWVAAGGEWRVATPICFEDVPSYLPRRMVYGSRGESKQVSMLVNLTNDGWFAGTHEPWQHEQIARFRCVENRVSMVRSVNRGVSSFIDSAGRIVKRVEVEGESVNVAGFAIASMPLDMRSTLFGLWGDTLAWISVAVTAGLTLLSGLVILTRKKNR